MKLQSKKVTAKDIIKPGSGLYSKGESAPSGGSVAGWFSTNRKDFKNRAETAKTEGNRTPELWVRDGEKRLVRFVDPDAIVSFDGYRLKVGGRWNLFVKPADGDIDLFASDLNLRPSCQFVYRVVDVAGYESKKTKQKVMNVPRFYRVGARQYEGIMLTAETHEVGLNTCNWKICRAGQDKQTVYTYVPIEAQITSGIAAAIKEFPKWQDFYKPLNEAQQRAIVNRKLTGAGEEDDDDAA